MTNFSQWDNFIRPYQIIKSWYGKSSVVEKKWGAISNSQGMFHASYNHCTMRPATARIWVSANAELPTYAQKDDSGNKNKKASKLPANGYREIGTGIAKITLKVQVVF